MKHKNKDYRSSLNRIRRAFVAEILLALCIATTVVAVGLNTLSKQTAQYAANINADYNAAVDSYTHEFRFMTSEIMAKIAEDPSVEELTAWLRGRHAIFENEIGADVFRGIGLTYKGQFVYSMDEGDFSGYDPLSRPWYQQAEAAQGEITVVSPYLRYQTDAAREPEIVMSIAQRLDDAVTFDYDIKNSGLKQLLANRELIYNNTLMLLCDEDGYILSSSDDEQFGHNVLVEDAIISRSFSGQIRALEQSQDGLHLMNVDGTLMVAAATRNEDGLLFIKMIPVISVILQDFLFITLIIVLVVIFVLWQYHQNKNQLKEFQRRDERLTCITNASYEQRVYVDMTTMTFYGNEWAASACRTDQYAELFQAVRKRVLNESDRVKYDSFISENALRTALDDMYNLRAERFSMRWQSQDGTVADRIIELSRLASIIDGRPVVGILFNDATESAEVLKDALKQAESASRAKGDFMSRMSHEIRTPLNAIIGYIDIAKDDSSEQEKVAHCLEQTSVAARHLLSIVNDILDISSIESGRMKLEKADFDLTQMIHSLTTIFYGQAKKKDLRFEVQLEEITEEWINGDSLRVNQILLNLLSNAIKFTPENGVVKLSVRQAGLIRGKVHMQFQVSDTGIGMSRDYLDRIFRPFEQENASTARNYGGTGLGLSICYNLVQMMEGKIDVTSEQGKGTTFTVTLAFDTAQKLHKKELATLSFGKIRALVVDDEENSCEYIQKLLQRCGVKCDTMTSGTKAVRRVRNRMASEHPYNICIIDWNMAELNGIETARQIKAICGDQMPVIIASSYDYSAIVDEAKAAGVSQIIAKPLFQSTLFDLLVNTFGKYEPMQTEKRTPVDFKGLKVLLAEDNAMNMEIAMDILGKAGMKITPAVNGREAADAFIHAAPGTFDAVLMDVQMPVMNGYEATRAIRESGHPQAGSVPIIAMTANAFTSDITAALAAGMNDHIAKPIDFTHLFKALSDLLPERMKAAPPDPPKEDTALRSGAITQNEEAIQ